AAGGGRRTVGFGVARFGFSRGLGGPCTTAGSGACVESGGGAGGAATDTGGGAAASGAPRLVVPTMMAPTVIAAIAAPATAIDRARSGGAVIILRHARS